MLRPFPARKKPVSFTSACRSRWPHPRERFLIVDIGGGSAEIILSENDHIVQSRSPSRSVPLRLQELFLRTDPPRPAELHRLEEYIEERIGSAVRRIGLTRIDRVVGTSATASAVVCAVNRIPRSRRDESDRKRAATTRIRQLYKAQYRLRRRRDRQNLTGIGPRRAEIIIPGVAVLLHVLDAFRMPALFYSSAGVRDGIIADLAARGHDRGLAQLTGEQRKVVEEMAERFAVPLRHARKSAPARQQSCSAVSSLYTNCRPTMAGCSKPPPAFTMSAISSATPGTTSILITW